MNTNIRSGFLFSVEEMKYCLMGRADAFPEPGKPYRIEWMQFQGTASTVRLMLAGARDCSSQAPSSLDQGTLSSELSA